MAAPIAVFVHLTKKLHDVEGRHCKSWSGLTCKRGANAPRLHEKHTLILDQDELDAPVFPAVFRIPDRYHRLGRTESSD